MYGVGTEDVNLTEFNRSFVSALGIDGNSWGFSYLGRIQHNGNTTLYGNKLSQGVVLGILLDLSLGYLEFFINRRSMGVAFRNIPTHKAIYPMVCSTASISSLRVINYSCFEESLTFRSYEAALRNGMLKDISCVPGLKHIMLKYWYLNSTPKYSHQTDSNALSIEDETVIYKTIGKRKRSSVQQEQDDNIEESDLYRNLLEESDNGESTDDDDDTLFLLL